MIDSVLTKVDEAREDGQVAIGRHSYYHGNPFILHPAGRIEVGSFCSIALEVRLLSGGEHALDLPSTYPLRTFLTRAGGGDWDCCPKGPIRIGSDVWIGHGSLVISGVTIGHGAVIGAGAVVTKDVAPYAIVGGNPARVIGHRFDEPTIARMLALKWWDWPDERLVSLDAYFYGDVAVFLEVAEALAQGSDRRTPAAAALTCV